MRMDDVTFRIRAQFVERIIWIVIILILLIALVVVSVYKTEQSSATTTTPDAITDQPAPEPTPVTPPPATTPTPKPIPAPTPPPAGLSGTITFSVDKLDCQQLSAAGNTTRAKINSIGITLNNGKPDALNANMALYLWDSDSGADQDVPRTGNLPIRIGTIVPGKSFNDFVNVRNKPTTFNDLTLDHFLKAQILDDAKNAVATSTVKFRVSNG